MTGKMSHIHLVAHHVQHPMSPASHGILGVSSTSAHNCGSLSKSCPWLGCSVGLKYQWKYPFFCLLLFAGNLKHVV